MDPRVLLKEKLRFTKKPFHRDEERKILKDYIETYGFKLGAYKAAEKIEKVRKNGEYYCLFQGEQFILHRNLVERCANKTIKVLEAKRKKGFYLVIKAVVWEDKVQFSVDNYSVKVLVNGVIKSQLTYDKRGGMRPNQVKSRLEQMENPFGSQNNNTKFINTYLKLCYELFGY